MRGRSVAFLCAACLAACGLLADTEGLTGGQSGASGDSSVPAESQDGAVLDAGRADDGGGATDGLVLLADGAPVDAATNVACTTDAGCTTGGPCFLGKCLGKPSRVAVGGAKIFGIAVRGADLDLFYAHNTDVLLQPLDGGLLKSVDDQGALSQMSLDDAYLYFARSFDISRTPLDGGPTEVLHSQSDAPMTAVVKVGSELFFTAPFPGAGGATTLLAIPNAAADGGAAKVVATGFTWAEGVHVAGTTVYVADRLKGCIWTVPVGGGTPTVLLAVPQAQGVFVDPPTMWLTSRANGGVVYKTSSDGKGPLEPIAAMQPNLSQVVATATTVYWAADVAVMSLPR